MRDNPEGDELDPAVDDRRRCKNHSSSVLSCIDKRTKGCDSGSTVHSGLSGEGPVPLRKPMESGKRESCERESFLSSSPANNNNLGFHVLCE